MKVKLITAFLLFTVATFCNAQTLQAIETQYFRLIFVADIEAEARVTAERLDQYLRQHLEDLPVDANMPAIDVVLQTQGHDSNGFVGIFPYRSVWLNKPMPLANLEWYDLLAVHEGRHIVQLNQWRDSPWLSLVSNFFGSDIATGASLMMLPEWYWEGDATISETVYTPFGRGRNAAFDLWFRADVIHNEPYHYDRTILGTGFERYPYLSEYVYGYYLTAYLQMNYGEDLFERLFERLGSWQGSTFNAELNKLTGKPIEQHHQEMLRALRETWQQELAGRPSTSVTKRLLANSQTWQSYYPIGVDNDTLWALKVGVNGYSVGTLIDDQWTSLVEVPAAVARSYYSGLKAKSITVYNGQVCWVQERTALVAAKRSYGDIRCWSQEDGYRWLSHQQKYTSVVAHAGGFVVHQFDESRQSKLVWLTSSLEKLTELPLPTGALAHDLSVSQGQLVFILTGNDRPGLYAVSSDSMLTLLRPSDKETMRAPVWLNDQWLTYNSDRSGTDQIYVVHTPSQQVWHSSRPFGAYYPLANNQQLWFSDYQTGGQDLVAVPLPGQPSDIDPLYWVVAQASDKALYVQPLVHHDRPTSTSAAPKFTVKPYRAWKHLWNPTDRLVTTDFQQITAKVSSQNVLDTLQIQLSGGYDFNNQSPLAGSLIAYRLSSGYKTILQGALAHDQQRLSSSLLVPMQWQWGSRAAVAVPAIGVEQDWRAGGAASTYLQADVSLDIGSDRAMFAARPTQSFSASYTARYDTQQDNWSLANQQTLVLAGWHSLHALSLDLQSQWLSWDTPLIDSQMFFTHPDMLGFSGQASLAYLINSGAQGYKLGSLAFLRNTEFSAGVHYQQQPTLTDQLAISASMTPSIMFFRQSTLRLWPKLTVAYELERAEVFVNASIDLSF